jgi:Rod binding domain-containing protein
MSGIDGISGQADLAVSQGTAGKQSLDRVMRQKGDNAAVERAAREFEGMFMAQMMAPMWEGIESNETFGGGHGEDVWRGMMVQEYGKIAARSGTLGIADMVKREMLAIQERQSQPKIEQQSQQQ